MLGFPGGSCRAQDGRQRMPARIKATPRYFTAAFEESSFQKW
jgi:hypothetical protein